MLYANDVLIFAEAKLQSICLIKSNLVDYYSWTGPKINMRKLVFIYSKAMMKRKKKKFYKRIGFRLELVYIGFKIILRRYIDADFLSILQHTLEKLNSWSGKNLSFAGRNILI